MNGGMRISAWAGTTHASVADVVTAVSSARADGFAAVWLAQTLSVDAMVALAVAAAAVPDIGIGTAVVPIQGRHPIPLAQQAMTVADAAGPGRFTLGLGVTHAMVSEGFYGIPYRDTVALCAEELESLFGLLGPDRRADHTGRFLTARSPLMMSGPAPGVVLGAMGPKMLELAGRLTDGTVTWMTGPSTLHSSVVPVLQAAAAAAGRPSPRVIVGLPVCVTADPAGARDTVRPRIENAGKMPSYRRQLASEGLDDLAELAIVGSAAEVVDRIGRLGEVGVTELMADVFGTPDERAATIAALTGRVR